MFIKPTARIQRQANAPPSAVLNAVENNTASVWYRDPGLRRLGFWLFIIFTSQICTGYDATMTSNFQSFAIWKSDMGNPSSSKLGLITSIYFIGTFVGSIPAQLLSDRYGRKVALAVGQTFTIIGAGFQAGSKGADQYIGARFILGFGIAFTTNAGPALLNEIAHPRMRGLLASCFNNFWYVGSICAAWTCFGTSHMDATNHWAWRLPSILQAFLPIFTVPLLYFAPESPRWLTHKGRKDEARDIIAKYHANGDLDDPLVIRQMEEIDLVISQAAEGLSWKALVTEKPNQRRLFVLVVMSVMILWNGQNIITYYFSIILNSVGITSTTQQTGINGGLNIFNLISAIAGAFLADRIGRRPLWMSSFIGMIIVGIPFTVLSAVYLQTKSSSVAGGTIACLFLYDFAFNIACNGLLYSYPVEIMPFFMRSKGLAIKNLANQVALITNQYVNPIALTAIGYKYYIVYICLNLVWLTLIFLFFPETKGYSLEELSMVFDDTAAILKAPGHGDLESEGLPTGSNVHTISETTTGEKNH